MSTAAKNFAAVWRNDGSATLLGRVTARNGTGAATGVAGEGNYIKQADVSAIAANAFDMSAAPDTASALAIAVSAILDTPITTSVLWTADKTGYNFLFDIPPGTFANGNHTYRIEIKITLTGGAVLWGVFEGPALKVQS
jgi:hypothetical protein